MANFTYSAQTQGGQIKKGKITSQSKASAIAMLRSKQLQPIIIKEDKGKINLNIVIPGTNNVKSKDLVLFTREFATMIDAGVPILRTLTMLRDQTRSVVLKKVLGEVVDDVQGGTNLSDAMAKHPNAFSNIYVNMVRAGEAGGILDEVLNRLAYQQEKDSALKGKIRGAMIYPSVIFTVTMVAFFVLMTFIVPKIGKILVSLSQGKAKLPVYTRALLAVSHTMKSPVFLFAVVIVLPIAILIFRRYIKTPHGRYKWHSLLLRIPIVKDIISKTAIARFSRTFASLMGAGVPIIDTIDITAGAIGNAVIEKELLDCAKAIQAGGELSIELEKSKHFPPIVSQMLAVGEETGKTDTIVLKIADFYEEEVDTAVGALSSVIEPVMILFLGTMVGLIAISVFGPVTQLSTSLGG